MRAHSHAKANGLGPLANGFIMPSFPIKTPPFSDASRDGAAVSRSVSCGTWPGLMKPSASCPG